MLHVSRGRYARGILPDLPRLSEAVGAAVKSKEEGLLWTAPMSSGPSYNGPRARLEIRSAAR